MKMTFRQRMLKLVYPVFLWWSKKKSTNRIQMNTDVQPPVPFYSLNITLNDGSTMDMNSLKGKKVLLVNTASDCGYTPQYDSLQELHEHYKDKLVIIGFPANDFGEQERGDDAEIASFCRKNFGVTFPLAKKSTVIAGPDQNPVFVWLTSKDQNGWNEQQPPWNFSKYLVNESGVLTHYFAPSVSPVGEEVATALV